MSETELVFSASAPPEVEDDGGGVEPEAHPAAASGPQIVVTDSRLPSEQFILEGVDVAREPVFTVSEVAKVFFARSPHWIRWRERKGFFSLDGEEIGGDRTDGGARRYTLADIEKMAHALAEKGAISGAQLTNALLLVQIEARLWGYLP